MGASTRTPAQFSDTVKTAFATHWTAAGEDLSIVAWDNLDFDPADRDAYLVMGLAHSSGSIAALGAGNTIQMRRVAVLAGQLFIRHNTGKARADALAEILLDFVESTHLAGIRFREQSMIEAGRVQQWFQVNVNALLEYDSFRSV